MLNVICYNTLNGIIRTFKSDIIPKVGEYIQIDDDWYIIKKVKYKTDGKYFENVTLDVEKE